LKESSQVSGNNWEISIPNTRIHTLEQLIKAFEIDTEIWEVKRFIANKWDMGYVVDGKASQHELYQVKAFLERKVEVVAAKKEIEDLMKLAKSNAPQPKAIKKPASALSGMLEINLTDHHFGKMAWGLETLGANYDAKIATRVFHRALDTILNRSPFANYKEIWFVVGNDLLNSDDTMGRTTAGTQVESDFRHEKTYVMVRTLMVQAIEKLRHVADKVKVIVVPGNHDHNATWHLGDSLELYFSKYSDVEVDNRPSSRKYHRFGETLIGYTHGHKSKGKNLPLLMTVEAREDFGKTKFHEWHTGHTHQTRTEEFNGIRVRVLPALCPPDAWHSEMGFVGNLRSSEAFVWDAQQGLIGIVIYTDNDDLIEKASPVPTAVIE
jgi:predicted phosphodiesterase